MKVEVKKVGAEYLNALVEVERLAWASPGQNIEASKEKILRRITSYNGDQVAILATFDDDPAGSQYAFCFNWDRIIEKLSSWDEHTAEGWTDKVHQSGGNTGFLVGVGVVPKFRGAKVSHNLRWQGKYKISELLIGKTLDELFRIKKVQAVIANARIPFYHKRSNLTVDEYCTLRMLDGRLFDPVLRFHERMGATIIKPVVYSMEDEESLNGGCWVLYNQPFQG